MRIRIEKAPKRPKSGRGFPDSGEFETLHKIADKVRPLLQISLTKGIISFQGKVDLNETLVGLQTGDISRVIDSVPFEEFAGEIIDLRDPMLAAAIESGEAQAAFLNRSVSRLIPTIPPRFAFNTDNPRIARIIDNRMLLITNSITNETRSAIAKTVTDAFNFGQTARETTKDIADVVGMTTRQATALTNFRRNLEAENFGGLTDVQRRVIAPRTRNLNFRDAAIRGKFADRVGSIDAKVDKYKDRLIKDRANNIARTESIFATSAGQAEIWEQAAEEGLYDRNGARKEWIVTPDDRLCPFCEPLAGVRIPLAAQFQSDLGPVDQPPLHPRCRCAMNLIFAEEL